MGPSGLHGSTVPLESGGPRQVGGLRDSPYFLIRNEQELAASGEEELNR